VVVVVGTYHVFCVIDVQFYKAAVDDYDHASVLEPSNHK